MPRRAFVIRDEESASWRFVSGSFEVQASRSLDDRRPAATLEVRDPDRPGAVPDSRPGVQARAASPTGHPLGAIPVTLAPGGGPMGDVSARQSFEWLVKSLALPLGGWPGRGDVAVRDLRQPR